MTILESIISGLVQGITEFLPISSSGHLVLLHNFFGITEPNMLFDVLLHFATMLAVLVYFREDITSLVTFKNNKVIFYIVIGTIPAVLAGLFFEDRIEEIFNSPQKVFYMLIVTSLVLSIGQLMLWLKKKTEELNWKNSLLIGVFQAMALIPGISRSGTTVTAGLIAGINKEAVFKFSFLLSIPIILAATLYKIVLSDIGGLVGTDIVNYTAGMLSAFFIGLISLKILWQIIKRERLYIFAIYCMVVGLIGLLS